ncbi:MAG: ferredoxin [Elusimicrobia bacterium]|nr:ferredoxin [Candidatus Liberimonas magnetica]
MKVYIDKEACTGCGLCVSTCPDVFDMDENLAVAKQRNINDKNKESVKQAAKDCPLEAIKIEE